MVKWQYRFQLDAGNACMFSTVLVLVLVLIVTSAEGGYVFTSVCLSACLSVCLSVCLSLCPSDN